MTSARAPESVVQAGQVVFEPGDVTFADNRVSQNTASRPRDSDQQAEITRLRDLLSRNEVARAEWNTALSKRNAAVATLDTVIRERDAAFAEREAVVDKLRRLARERDALEHERDALKRRRRELERALAEVERERDQLLTELILQSV